MKHLQIIITALLFCTYSLSYSQDDKIYLSKAINIAGKQRMLAQRMAKNKVFKKAEIYTPIIAKELKESINDFEKALKNLKDFAPTDAIKYKIDIQEHAYKTYKENILSSSKKSLTEILDINTLFLAICDDVVTELINYSKEKQKTDNEHKNYVINKVADATSASGKLRYLTQRLTLYFSINEFGFKKVTPIELDAIVKSLDKNLNYLVLLEFNTIDIDDSLSQLNYQWNELKNKLYNKNGIVNMDTTEINATALYRLCNIILSEANTTTKMYADLNKS